MIRFGDGPAANVVRDMERAPAFLRVAQTLDGLFVTYEALDALPTDPGGTLYAYRKTLDHGFMQLPNRRELVAVYRLHDNQPAPAVMRDNAIWRQWCADEYADLHAGDGV